jgi:asparagine synthase (glutamine-hydrolysing)
VSAIVGIYYRDKRPVDQSDFDKMMASLAHRGQDGNDVWINGHVGLGHQMRWITPESLTEKLPFYDSNRRLTITADARIDNRAELFSKLVIPPNEREAIPDSQLIMYAYEKWGESCVDHFIGDFVFSIWDEKNQQFFCATDHMGHRPFYYFINDKFFAFASEIKALLKIPQVPKSLNEEHFSRMLVFDFTMQERTQTCFSGISSLKSGHRLVVSENKVNARSYWEPDTNSRIRFKSEGEYLEAFRELFEDAVHCRMRSPYPVVSMLSGGLDSSSIASVAAHKLQQSGKQLTCISSALPLGHLGPEKDERYYIDKVCDKWDINKRYIHPDGNGVYDELSQLFSWSENPLVSSRHYVYTAMQQAATDQGARVMLDGYGGDMLVSSHGNGFFAELLWRGEWFRLVRELRAQKKIENRTVLSLMREVLGPYAPHWLDKAYHKRNFKDKSFFGYSPIHPKFAKRMRISEQLHSEGKNLSWKFRPSIRFNEAMCLKGLRGSTTEFADPSGPILSFPCMDIRLLEFCLAIPNSLKVKNGWKRYLIRAGMQGILPTEVQWRKSKMPFSPDHPRRVVAANKQAKEIIVNIKGGNPAREYIHIQRIEEILESLDTQKDRDESDFYSLGGQMLLAQQGVYTVEFMEAFRAVFRLR